MSKLVSSIICTHEICNEAIQFSEGLYQEDYEFDLHIASDLVYT